MAQDKPSQTRRFLVPERAHLDRGARFQELSLRLTGAGSHVQIRFRDSPSWPAPSLTHRNGLGLQFHSE